MTLAQLARRFFHSFAKSGSEYIYLQDIARFFPNTEEAARVFDLIDKDTNGQWAHSPNIYHTE